MIRLHYCITVALGICIIPTLYALDLPVRLSWQLILAAFVLGAALQAIVGFGMMHAFEHPGDILKRIKAKTLGHLLVFAALAVFIIWRAQGDAFLITVWIGLSLIIPEIYVSAKGTAIKEVAKSSLYFIAAIILIFAFISIIAICKPFDAFDPALAKIDRALLFGWSVPEISRAALSHLPESAVEVFEVIYWAISAMIGGTLFWLSAHSEKGNTLRFVGTVVLAYQISMIVYFIIPNIGPLSVHGPNSGVSAEAQSMLLRYIAMVKDNPATFRIGPGYFIGFPSMHMAQAVIVAVFLRPWPRLFKLGVIYCISLATVIVILGWHYFIDILGGILVAFIALYLMKRPNLLTERSVFEENVSLTSTEAVT